MISLRRPFTDIDRLSEKYLEQTAQLDPIFATGIGVSGYDGLLPSYTPQWYEECNHLAQNTLRELNSCTPTDDIDEASADVLHEALTNSINLYQAGLVGGELNVLYCPIQAIGDQFGLLNLSTAEGRDNFLTRLDSIPTSLEGYWQALKKRVHDNLFPLRTLQVEKVLHHITLQIPSIESYRKHFTGDELVTFDILLDKASVAYTQCADKLSTLLPHSTTENAVGKEPYALFSRMFLGQDIDFLETYHWGQEQLASIVQQQHRICQQILPGSSLHQVYDFLQHDPAHYFTDEKAFVQWMQATSDEAIRVLRDTHFDIPQELSALECKIAPTGTGAVYYTSPNEDFSRPGMMWWSVPAGERKFFPWQERTTVYHEGVPGHHLQLGTAISSPELNRYRRLNSFISGHGEGWALYAEQFMNEIGLLPTPADQLGMLEAQRLRAARVVLDIGYHCQFTPPTQYQVAHWNYDIAWDFLRTNALSMNEKTLSFELDRYLGFPGQAPSYAIGQQCWLDIRREFLHTHPQENLRSFHRKALALGGIGLADLRKHILR